MPHAKTHNQTNANHVHIGCQGWNYNDWVSGPASGGIFYPHGTRTAEMLEVYARAFETVEVDSTFYAVPSAATVDGWMKRTPTQFTFSLKLPQEITHERGLREEAPACSQSFANAPGDSVQSSQLFSSNCRRNSQQPQKTSGRWGSFCRTCRVACASASSFVITAG